MLIFRVFFRRHRCILLYSSKYCAMNTVSNVFQFISLHIFGYFDSFTKIEKVLSVSILKHSPSSLVWSLLFLEISKKIFNFASSGRELFTFLAQENYSLRYLFLLLFLQSSHLTVKALFLPVIFNMQPALGGVK